MNDSELFEQKKEAFSVRFKRFVSRQIRRWKSRHIDEDLCCCGEMMSSKKGNQDSICSHGGCRSMKDYYIDG